MRNGWILKESPQGQFVRAVSRSDGNLSFGLERVPGEKAGLLMIGLRHSKAQFSFIPTVGSVVGLFFFISCWSTAGVYHQPMVVTDLEVECASSGFFDGMSKPEIGE